MTIRSSLSIVLMMACLMAWGQTAPMSRPIAELAFANFDDNHLCFPSGDSPTMEHFFAKLDSAVFFGKGNVNIMHIGGSHVQAGAFTQRFRDNLLEITPNLMGGKFFLFPFSAGKTNNPSHFKVRYTGEWSYCRNAVVRDNNKTMGLAGAALTTSDPTATISIMTRAKSPSAITPEFKFNKVSVLGYSETKNVIPVIAWEDSIISGEYNESQEAYTFRLPSFTDSISILLANGGGEFTLTGVLLENGLPGVSLHCVGVNGASVPSYLRCKDFERDLRLITPDLVIFGIGINDAAEHDFDPELFKRNYDQLIATIKHVNPDCAFIFITNNDSYRRVSRRKYTANPNGRLAEQAMTELAEKHHTALWDQFHIMGGFKSMKDWEREKLAAKDKIHFTTDGYNLMGDLLYNAFIETYVEHIKQNARK